MPLVEHDPAPLDRVQHRVLLDLLLLVRVQVGLVVVIEAVLDRRGARRTLRIAVLQRTREDLTRVRDSRTSAPAQSGQELPDILCGDHDVESAQFSLREVSSLAVVDVPLQSLLPDMLL